MRNSDRNPGWFRRLRRASGRLGLLSRGVLLGALIVAGFTAYHLWRAGSTAEQAVALAQQEGEGKAATATPEATPDGARQAVKGTTQSSGQGRSDTAAPVADAGFARPFTVEDDLAYVTLREWANTGP